MVDHRSDDIREETGIKEVKTTKTIKINSRKFRNNV
jgi:hypothetical protein